MDDSLKLSLNQKQQQTLAPMQLQLVRMLEMNAPEIEEEVRKALDENPALEAENDEDTTADNMSSDGDDAFNESAEQMQLADYRTDDDIPSYRLESSNRSAGGDDIYEPVAVAGGESLIESLMSQLAENPAATPLDLDIARFLVGNIDNNGYMTRSVRSLVDDMAIQDGLEVSEDEVRRVWNMVRSLDPPGIGAVDLRDALLLQLKRRTQTPDVMLATDIIRDYFDLFSLMHFDRIRSLTGADKDRLKEAMETIRSLNPKPGAQISSTDDDRTHHISPDFLVEADGDILTLTLLNRIPRLQIEESFAAGTLPQSRRRSAETDAANAFIRQKRDEAATFIKVLETRQRTLFRVMSAIMQWQRDFFLSDDPLTLRPMILKDISAVTGDDLSVISRATAGKYVATGQGVYPLRFFFNERRKDDNDTSSQVILDRLRTIIEQEDKSHPLSDAAITEILHNEGFDIARRTVAKYRERLGLPVGRLRKQL